MFCSVKSVEFATRNYVPLSMPTPGSNLPRFLDAQLEFAANIRDPSNNPVRAEKFRNIISTAYLRFGPRIAAPIDN